MLCTGGLAPVGQRLLWHWLPPPGGRMSHCPTHKTNDPLWLPVRGGATTASLYGDDDH